MSADIARDLFETIAAFIVALGVIAAAAWRLIKPHVRDFVRSVKDVESSVRDVEIQVKPNGNRQRDDAGTQLDHTNWTMHDLASEAKVKADEAQAAARKAAEQAAKVIGQIDVLMEFATTNRTGILGLNKRVEELTDRVDEVAADVTVTSSTVVETQHDVVEVKESLAAHVAEGERFLEGALEQLGEQGIYLSSRPQGDADAEATE